MKIVFFVTALILGMGLTGCVSTEEKSDVALSRFDSNVDYEKMARVTRAAMNNGYRIVWVHPPQKKSASR